MACIYPESQPAKIIWVKRSLFLRAYYSRVLSHLVMQTGWPGLGICCTILILWSIFLSVFCLSACKLMICPSLVARFPEEACQRWTHSAVPRPSTPHTCWLWASKFQKVMQFLVKFFYIHILWLKRPTPLPPSIPEIPKIWEDLFIQISLWTHRWSVETSLNSDVLRSPHH